MESYGRPMQVLAWSWMALFVIACTEPHFTSVGSVFRVQSIFDSDTAPEA